MTALFKSPRIPAPPPPPDPPAQVDMKKAAALSEEALKTARKRRGRASTVVAGAGLVDEDGMPTGTTPTLMS